MTDPPLPRLHLVTDDATLAGPSFVATAGTLLAVGGSQVALHLRGPRTPGRRLWQAARALAPAAESAEALLVVNDRVDVALAAGVGTVHLGQRSIPAGQARALLGEGGPVGRKLDFLMQEFNREANTLSSKSTTSGTTQIAVELKVLIEQMREQIQNIE